jgi:hypothetical protein
MTRAIALLVSLAACAELPELGVCGNGIVEADLGEACDGREGCTETCEVACTINTDGIGVCDDGQTCGTDEVCRAPSGMFAPVGSPQIFNVAARTAGDFDVDGVVDLVGTSATEIVVLFGSATGDPLTRAVSQDVPTSYSPPVLYERDVLNMNNSKLSLAVPTDGIAVMVSDDGTSFMPRIEGTYSFPTSRKIDVVVADPVLGDVILEVADPAQPAVITVERTELPGAVTAHELDDCTIMPALLIGASVSRDRRTLVVGADRGNADDWVVCVYRQTVDGFEFSSRTVVNSAPPTSLRLANLDADACEEIVIARAGTDTTIEVVRTNASCQFANSVTSLSGGTLVGTSTPILATGPVLVPDRDAILLDNGVYVIDEGALVPVTPFVQARRWRDATVTDLNGDGIGDVVASLRDRRNVEIVRGGSAAGLNSYQVTTNAEVVEIKPGDFDGDGVGDAALVERSGNVERLAVLYGRVDGAVEPPLANSRFQGTIDIAPLRQISWGRTARGSDGVDDLFVKRTFQGMTTGDVVIGDASRILTMPTFPLPPRTSIGTLAVGRMGTDVGAVAVRAVSPTSSELVTFDLLSTFTTVPLDDVLVDTTEPGTVLHTEAGPLVAFVTTTGFGVFDRTGVQCTGAPTGEATLLHAVDLDGDGFDELAAYITDEMTDEERVRVYDVTGGAACQIGEELLADALATCFDVARVDTTVVATCKAGVFDPGVYRIVDGVREEAPFVEFDGSPRVITAADYDGDGVTDLAIALLRGGGLGSVQVVRQCPAHDTRGCR